MSEELLKKLQQDVAMLKSAVAPTKKALEELGTWAFTLMTYNALITAAISRADEDIKGAIATEVLVFRDFLNSQNANNPYWDYLLGRILGGVKPDQTPEEAKKPFLRLVNPSWEEEQIENKDPQR